MEAFQPSDRELVRRFVERGDEAAFRTLYRRHTPAMHALLRRLLDPDEAEDVLQESWLRAARGVRSFRGESALRTWLLGIALNRVREVLRSRGRWDGPVPKESAWRPEPGRALDLRSAVDRLPAGYRAVLMLHDAWGYTHAEVARLLGVEEGTSKSQLWHARRAVRAWLTDGEERR